LTLRELTGENQAWQGRRTEGVPLAHRASEDAANNGTIVTYGSDAIPEPTLPLYPLMRCGITIRLVGVFLMPAGATQAATDEITRLHTNDELTHPIAARYPLESIAAAHSAVEDGQQIGKILITLATDPGQDDADDG